MSVAVLAVAGAVFLSAVPDCPGSTTGGSAVYFANPDDCSTFWECHEGDPTLLRCPEDLYYCPQLEACSYRWDTSCSFNCTTNSGGGIDIKGAYCSGKPADVICRPPDGGESRGKLITGSISF